MVSFKPSSFLRLAAALAAAALIWWLQWALQAPPGVIVRVPLESVTSQSALLCWQPLPAYAAQIVDYNIYVNGLLVGRASEQNPAGASWGLPPGISGFDVWAASSVPSSSGPPDPAASSSAASKPAESAADSGSSDLLPVSWYLTGLEDYTDYLVEVEPLLKNGQRLARTTYEFMTPQHGEVLYSMLSGAKGDGVTDDTSALQKALDQCPPGGTVYLNEGTYLCGPLQLHADLTLYLTPRAKILARPMPAPAASSTSAAESSRQDPKTTPPAQNVPAEAKAAPFRPALLNAAGAQKIQLRGGGTLDGNHQNLELIHFQDVADFLIEDVTFVNSAKNILGLEKCRQGVINQIRLERDTAEPKLYTRDCQDLVWANNVQLGS
jgi:hypothetical protein